MTAVQWRFGKAIVDERPMATSAPVGAVFAAVDTGEILGSSMRTDCRDFLGGMFEAYALSKGYTNEQINEQKLESCKIGNKNMNKLQKRNVAYYQLKRRRCKKAITGYGIVSRCHPTAYRGQIEVVTSKRRNEKQIHIMKFKYGY